MPFKDSESYPILFSCNVLFCSAERDIPCFHSFGFKDKEFCFVFLNGEEVVSSKTESNLRVEAVALTLSGGLRHPSVKFGPAAE